MLRKRPKGKPGDEGRSTAATPVCSSPEYAYVLNGEKASAPAGAEEGLAYDVVVEKGSSRPNDEATPNPKESQTGRRSPAMHEHWGSNTAREKAVGVPNQMIHAFAVKGGDVNGFSSHSSASSLSADTLEYGNVNLSPKPSRISNLSGANNVPATHEAHKSPIPTRTIDGSRRLDEDNWDDDQSDYMDMKSFKPLGPTQSRENRSGANNLPATAEADKFLALATTIGGSRKLDEDNEDEDESDYVNLNSFNLPEPRQSQVNRSVAYDLPATHGADRSPIQATAIGGSWKLAEDNEDEDESDYVNMNSFKPARPTQSHVNRSVAYAFPVTHEADKSLALATPIGNSRKLDEDTGDEDESDYANLNSLKPDRPTQSRENRLGANNLPATHEAHKSPAPTSTIGDSRKLDEDNEDEDESGYMYMRSFKPLGPTQSRENRSGANNRPATAEADKFLALATTIGGSWKLDKDNEDEDESDYVSMNSFKPPAPTRSHENPQGHASVSDHCFKPAIGSNTASCNDSCQPGDYSTPTQEDKSQFGKASDKDGEYCKLMARTSLEAQYSTTLPGAVPSDISNYRTRTAPVVTMGNGYIRDRKGAIRKGAASGLPTPVSTPAHSPQMRTKNQQELLSEV